MQVRWLSLVSSVRGQFQGRSGYSFLARLVFAMLALVLLAAPSANAQGLSCSSVTAVPNLVRAEGMAEYVGDIVIQCTATTPGVRTPAGNVVPTANVHVSIPGTTITSRRVVSSASSFTEALLIVDDAGKPGSAVTTQTYCGKGGNDSGPAAGVCAIIAPPDGTKTYDGTTGAMSNGTADTACSASAFGCGRPNIYQGQMNGTSELVFPSVPMDPPANNGIRTFRITNVRIDATMIDPRSTTGALAVVTIEGTAAVAVPNSSVPVAFTQTGFGATQVTADFGFLQCASEPNGTHTQNMKILVSEGFRTAWLPRNVTEYLSNYSGAGTISDWITSFNRFTYNGAGTTNNLTDIGQNVPDYHYFTESGLLLDPSTTGTENGINLAGRADYGTRIAIPISAPPAGSTLSIPTVAFLSNGRATTGVMVMVAYTGTGVGAYLPVSGPSFTLPAGGGTVVYEVLFSDPGSVETATIVPTLTYTYDSTNNLPATGAIYVTRAGFAPTYATTDASSALPRFQAVNPGNPYGLTGIAPCGVAPTGTINVSSVPSGAGYSITGPANYSGTANATINSAPVGNYSITWTDLPGNYTTPPPETRAVVPTGVGTFVGSYGFPGTINITANVPGAQFQLTGPGGSVSGTAPASFTSMPLGRYSVVWTVLPDGSGSAPGGGLLTSGGTISVNGNYVTTGQVDVSSNVNAPFVLVGPNGYQYSGVGPFAATLPMGSYTITWGTVSYFGTPAPQTAILVGGSGISFFGEYATSGTINLTSSPTGASFELAVGGTHISGVTPASFSNFYGGGVFTVTWLGQGAPPPETKTLTGGTTITFNATYLPTGVISLTSTPTGAGYSVSGPGGTFTGVTPSSVAFVVVGDYTVTWSAMGNYGTPPNQTQTLTADSTLTFNGAYVTTGTVSATSNITGATFSLSGPGGTTNGTAGTPIPNLPIGVYTITWNANGNYGTPLQETKTLTAGANLGFTGSYATTGAILTNSNISGATFSLSGPGGTTNGTAGTPIGNLPVGSYTITWNASGNNGTPAQETKTLTGGTTLSFTGNYATTGTISTNSNISGATFTLSGPGGTTNGTAGTPIGNLLVGSYTITWNASGNNGTPAQETKTLTGGATLTFTGTYATTGTISPTSNISGATFSLSGPGGTTNGVAGTPIGNLPVGSYTITWNVSGNNGTPAQQTQTLTGGATLTFNGAYLTTGTVSPTSNVSGATFSLSGPGGVTNGTAGTPIGNLPVGSYTITWNANGNNGTPAQQTQTLTGGATLTFNGAYITTGTISPTSNVSGTTFSLSGPGGTTNGVAGTPIANLPVGSYTITWNANGNNGTPAQQTQTLTGGATLSFAGNYVTTGTVSPTSNISGATFSLSGPGGTTNGTAGAPIANLPVGSYTITWNASGLNGTPSQQTQTLTGGATLSFAGSYVTTGTISATSNVAGASFSVSGPGGAISGVVGTPIANLPVGSYTITWNTSGNLGTPSPETKNLTGGTTLTFTGNYISTGTVFLSSTPTGAGYDLTGPNNSHYSGTTPAMLSAMALGSYTVTWSTVPGGYLAPPGQTLSLTTGGTTISFYGQYADTADINVVSEPPYAPFDLVGPNNTHYSGTAPVSYSNMPIGGYTITWSARLDGWGTPPPAQNVSVVANAPRGTPTTIKGTYTPPTLIVPGMLESFLQTSTSQTVWADRNVLAADPCNVSLLAMALAANGSSPSPALSFNCGGTAVSGAGLTLQSGGIFNNGVGTNQYAGLIADIAATGRQVKTFSFDWRTDLISAAQALRQTILQIAPHPTLYTDVVAHDWAGLVVRAYAALYPTEASRVRSVIYLGTPQLGAPKSFGLLQSWQGRTTADVDSQLTQYLNFDAMNAASRNFPSLYEMLPHYSYFGTAGAPLDSYSTTNALLSNQVLVNQAVLAWGSALNGPNSIALSSAINGTNHATTRGFVQSNGCVVPTIGIRGDGVVPSESATALAGVANYFVDSTSNGLPSNSFARQSVVSLLQGAVPAGVQNVPFVDPNHVVTTIYTCNPMKMRVTNPANYLTGRDASGNAKQDIPGSQYFNFTNNEAAVVDGTDTLQVVLTASDYGFFTVGVAGSKGDVATTTYVFAGMPMANISKANFVYQPAAPPSLALDLNGDGTVDFTIAANVPPPPVAVLTAASVSIDTFGLPSGTANQLKNPLDSAVKAIAGGSVNNAQNSVNTFLQKVAAMRGKNLTNTQADILTAFGNRALQLLQ